MIAKAQNNKRAMARRFFRCAAAVAVATAINTAQIRLAGQVAATTVERARTALLGAVAARALKRQLELINGEWRRCAANRTIIRSRRRRQNERAL